MNTRHTFSKEYLIKTELPPMPAIVVRVMQMLDDMGISQRRIADAISFDPILTARILKLANSVSYSRQKPVLNLPAAVAAVGNDSIYAAIMITGLGDAFGRKVLTSPVGKDIWFHLLATAMLARDLCHLAGMRGTDEAFCCGLLHDIGKLIFLRADFPFYVQVIARAETDETLPVSEREAFGFDHAELGAAAARAWNLPQPICDMIRFHHSPSSVGSGTAIARVINIADTFVHQKVEGTGMKELFDSESVSAFGFTENQLESIWEDVIVRLEDVNEIFSANNR